MNAFDNAHALELHITETIDGGFVITWTSSPFAWQKAHYVASVDDIGTAVRLIKETRDSEELT